MKLLVLCTFLGVVYSAPQAVQLLKYNANNDGLGNYNFNFQQSDETSFDQTGELQNRGSETEFIAVKGSYSWIAPDGNKFYVDYTADEKGFHPSVSNGLYGRPPPELIALLNSS